MRVRGAGLMAVILVSASAFADIYTRTDDEGVIHFTNIDPKGREKKRWKRIYKTGPGKARALRGGCERCDIIPARDGSPERYSRFDDFIDEAVSLYQIPEALVRAVIKVESDYDPRVVSSAGARGLMQLMPGTSRDMHVEDAHDPRENILGGTRFLRILANRFGGDLVLTLAAYHAGPGAVARYGAIPPYETTQRYVDMVLKEYERWKARLVRRD